MSVRTSSRLTVFTHTPPCLTHNVSTNSFCCRLPLPVCISGTAFGEGYKVVAENVTGRLVEMTLKVGQSDPPHDHPKHYMYFVQGGKLTITDYAGGEKGASEEKEIRSGGTCKERG